MSKMAQQWFEVDKQGLADLVSSKGKVFILHELLQNAWDCPAVKQVDVDMVPVKGASLVNLTVIDDDPDGFKDLTHASTLFAPSEKKSSPERRGRFNLGEKLVLSLCTSAKISSTTGTVSFDKTGRHTSKIRRDSGTYFQATVRMTREEYEEVRSAVKMLMPPDRVETRINGVPLGWHETVDLFSAELPTVVADADTGVLRDSIRCCIVRLWEPKNGEVSHLYEMGIPVVELGGGEPWHVDVGQKVPLSMDRDNCTPLYLRRLRAMVLNRMASCLTPEQAKAPWVTSTLGSSWVDNKAVQGVVVSRFGAKAVIADPSDREGEHMAVAQGYTVVPGGAFPADAWARIREANALKPAGQVTPSPKPFSPDGTPLEMIDRKDWTLEMEAFAVFARRFAQETADLNVGICFTPDVGWKFQAAYSMRMVASDGNGTLIFNAGRLGIRWFDQDNWREQVELLIHELGHHWGQHLDASYHEALCRIGRVAVSLALTNPALFGGQG